MENLADYSSDEDSFPEVAVNQAAGNPNKDSSLSQEKTVLPVDLFGHDRPAKIAKKSEALSPLLASLTHYEEPDEAGFTETVDIDEQKSQSVLRFSMADFYKKNQQKIASGELDSEDIITRSSKIQYSANSGNNSLSKVIAFTNENEQKIDKAHQQKPSKFR